MALLRTLLDAPEQLLAAHDRLRASGFPIITIINARSALDARVWLGTWADAHQRVVITAPQADAEAALAACRARLPSGGTTSRSPVLRLPGPVREALPVAAQLSERQPKLALALTCGIADMVESLLDPALAQPFVGLALQGLVPVDDAERRVMAQIAAGRRVPLLRGPCEGILFYMLEARPETRGRFTPNARLNGRAKRSHEVDLACIEARLVVEIDGREHDAPRRRRMDADKQRDLEAEGYRVTRFSNATVIENPVGVWRDIADTLSRAAQKGAGA
ncbi:endonuclease domain-containing protein [Xanthobacter agilis]|uniref:endonuclease domain-containing protein n=1 Tax=Xanthobacter agilis TaxID=47492 RepID=UPI003726E62D